MAARGRTIAVNGFGLKVAGGGKRAAVVINGMALRDITLRARLARRLAGGGHFPVRLIGLVGVALMGISSRPARSIVRREVVSATVLQKKRSEIVSRIISVGAVSMERSS